MLDRLSTSLLFIHRPLPPSRCTFNFCRYFSSSSPLSVKKRMPPKKAPVQEKKVILGRPSNNLKIGIVGQSEIIVDSFDGLTRCV